MRKIILTATVLFAASGVGLRAQENESLSRRIEVTRQYVPEVEGARKIDYAPRMSDTVTLKPYIDYAITPTPWKSVFGTQPIEPVAISTARYEPNLPFYLRAGAGYPLTSTANLRASFGNPRARHFGIYADHDGLWQHLIDNSAPAGHTENRLGFNGGFAAGRRTFDYDLHYDLNAYQWNGLISNNFNYFNNFSAAICFGDSFADLSRFNYRIGIEGGLWGNSLQSLTHSGGVDATAGFAWPVGRGAILLDGGFNGGWSSGVADQLISVAPHYRIKLADLTLNVGAKLYFNDYRFDTNRGNTVYALPDISIAYAVLPSFEPYITIDGSVANGTYKDLYALNPYVAPLTAGVRSKNVSLQGGFRGSARDLLVYDLHAGHMVADAPCFIRSIERGSFTPIQVPLNVTYASANIGFHLPAGFGFIAGVQYNSYDNEANLWRGASTTPAPLGMGIPSLHLSGTVTYDYRNKLFTKLRADFVGKRYMADMQDFYTEIPSYVDLSLSVEYKFSNRFSMFLQGDNLLNQTIIHYLGYQDYGIRGMIGFIVVF